MSNPSLSRSNARPTLTLVSRRRLWPSSRKHPGLANGWHGSAWVAFKLAGGGIAVPAHVFEAIGRELAGEHGRRERAGGRGRIGAMIGCAADAVIAAYAARQGIASKAVARAACKHVVAQSARAGAWDLHMGLAGALLAFAEIAAVEPGALRGVHPGRLAARLLPRLDMLCALPPRGWQTGMAHGPAGAIVALETCAALGWCKVTTAHRQRWLDALSGAAVAAADGALLWPAIAGQRELGLQSWCAGTPGIALALLSCFRLTREPAYLEFARGALDGVRHLFDKAFFSKTLCCGSAGYRHIFVEAYRITGETAWLELAERDARYARRAGPRPRLGLHQGELGIAYLAERLAQPRAFPFPALGVSSM
ncbi:MAG TPA: lanthionine synthetase LanC family protein [Kofleriaceae bacterium]|nr:lanthionine synthetase LanC family protein [Kofleriaceae bacterium]